MIIDAIAFSPDADNLLELLRVKRNGRDDKKLLALIGEAIAVAKPKAIVCESFVDERGDDYVIIDGVRFNGGLLPANLREVSRVFPYVATCGVELEEWSEKIEGPLARYWADMINMTALGWAVNEVDRVIGERFNPGARSSMNPGSLEEWPIEEQGKLFSLFGGACSRIGVKLTENFTMTPLKSVSGITFPSESRYENCRLCRRENCAGRRALYDPAFRDELLAIKH